MTAPNLDRRMDRVQDRLSAHEPPCRSCGAPVVSMRWSIVLKDDQPLPICPGCGRTLTYDGTPMAPGAISIVLCPSKKGHEQIPAPAASAPPPPPREENIAAAGDTRVIEPYQNRGTRRTIMP